MGVRTDTRERMVTSAAVLLREKGVAGTSIAKVLEHAGSPRGSVQFHFPGGKKEMVGEALLRAGGIVTRMLSDATERGASPAEVLEGICAFYAAQLEATDFRAGCPVGAAAQEVFDDPVLAPIVRGVIDEWTTCLASVLAAAGHDPDEARDLAELCVCAVEGAITLARIERTSRPLRLVAQRLSPLL